MRDMQTPYRAFGAPDWQPPATSAKDELVRAIADGVQLANRLSDEHEDAEAYRQRIEALARLWETMTR